MVRKGICVTALAGLLCLLAPLALGQAVEELAAAVTQDVGVILQLIPGDGRVIFLFEERHDSALVQVEIAIMLNRLYADYGLRHIGLEGLAKSEGPLDCSWAHRPPPYRPGQPITPREDVIVQTLQDGEISAAEMMGLIYEDVVVDGIDDAALYAIPSPSGEAWSAPYNYLYSIALAGMSQVERIAWQALLDQGKEWEAFQFAVSTDEFTQSVFERLEDEVDYASAEELIQLFSDLREKVEEVGAELAEGVAQGLDECEEYLGVVSERSAALAENMLELAAAHPGAPLAMQVGAMHTDRVAEVLAAGGATVVVVRTQAQAEGSEAGLLDPEAYRRKQQGLSVDPDGWLGSFLDGRKKPPPASRTDWYKQEQAIRELLQWVAEWGAYYWHARFELSPEEKVNELNDELPEKLSEFGVSVGEWQVVDIARGEEEDSPPTVTLQATLPTGTKVRVRVRLRDRRKDELARDLTVRLDLAKYQLEHAEEIQAARTGPQEAVLVKPVGDQDICSNTVASWETAG